MSKTLETITLYFKDGPSDKFYVASIKEDGGKYSVPVTWGRRGTSGQSGYKAEGVSCLEAKKAYDKVVKEKTGKGYHEGEGMVPHAGIPESSVDTSLDGLDAAWESKSAKRKIDWKDEVVAKGTTAIPVGKVSSGLLPQLLNEIEEEEVGKYINDNNYCAQEKHDGKRRMLRHVSGKTEGINKKGQVVGYPAVFEGACKEVAEVSGVRGFLMDGEEVGEVFHVFDLLELDGKDLRVTSYGDRYRALSGLTIPSDSIQVVETAFTTKEKRTLYESLKRKGKEGIVFKLIEGVHRVGYSDYQVKFKFVSTASVVVMGHNKKNSISVGVYDHSNSIEKGFKSLIPIGNITTIGHDRSKIPIGSVCECRYLYYFPGGSLYQPVYLGQRDDTYVSDCLLSKLKCKSPVEG